MTDVATTPAPGRSRVAAALTGAVPAAVLGGIGTVLVALPWMRLFPSLRDADQIEEPDSRAT